MIKKFLETGKIVGTHGVKGMVRVQPWCDSPEFLKQFKHFYTDSNGETRLEVSSVQPHGNVVLMAIKGVDSIEKAEKLRFFRKNTCKKVFTLSYAFCRRICFSKSIR